MKRMKFYFLLVFVFCTTLLYGQTNTAGASGNIGKCRVWGFPFTLYNNASATKTINSGVTVTVNEDKNSGTINLNGTGALDLSGSQGITFSGSGTEINCRWDATVNSGNFTMINNDGYQNTDQFRYITSFFTAPYSGNYILIRGTGWSASVSSNYPNGGIRVAKNSSTHLAQIFYQSQAGTCNLPNTNAPPAWYNFNVLSGLNAGDTLQYAIGTGWTNNPSCYPTMNVTLGAAQIAYDN